MDWLQERQAEIEQRIAAKHLCEWSLILYDVTSTYEEGTTCPLAQYGWLFAGQKEREITNHFLTGRAKVKC